MLKKPNVKLIDWLSPSSVIARKGASGKLPSPVGTVTESWFSSFM
jgi:hypothetical protein